MCVCVRQLKHITLIYIYIYIKLVPPNVQDMVTALIYIAILVFPFPSLGPLIIKTFVPFKSFHGLKFKQLNERLFKDLWKP